MTTGRLGCVVAVTALAAACAHDNAGYATDAIAERVAALGLPEPTSTHPVVAAALIEPTDVVPGDEANLIIVARIAPGWHIYPLRASNTATSSTLVVDTPAGIELIADWTAPTPVTGPGGPTYDGEVRFTRPLLISGAITRGTRNVRCEFAFEACDISICRPRQTLFLNAELNIEIAD